MNDQPLVSSRLVFGLCLIALGTLWTLDQMGYVDAAHALAWWPVVPIVWGTMLVAGFGTRCRRTLGGIWLVIGVVGLLDKLHVWAFTLADLFPLFLVFVGGMLVVRASRGTRRSAEREPDEPGARLNFFTILSAARRRVTAPAFVGGEATAILGGLTLDLRDARLAQGHAVLDLFAMWGGIEVLAPAGWRVVSRVTPLLGAVVDSMPDPAGEGAPTLELRGLAVMGGVDVRSDDRVRRKIRTTIVGAHLGSDVHVGVVSRLRRQRDAESTAEDGGED